MHRGLYIQGRFWGIPKNDDDLIDVEEVERDLERFRDLEINLLWIIHKTAKETADIARRADRHGIQIVAALAKLDGSVEWQRKRTAEQVADLADEVMRDWGDAPKPLAWGMCDEPQPEYLGELLTYIDRWWRAQPWPVAVLPHVTNVEAVATIGCEVLGCFSYSYVKGAA